MIVPPADKKSSELFPESIRDAFAHIQQVLIIGPGEVFRKKIEPALKHLGLRNFLLYGPSCQGPNTLMSLEEIPDGAIAFILSPNGFHLEQALALLKRSVPFYLEKPMVINTHELAILGNSLSGSHKIYCGDYYFFKALPLLACFASPAALAYRAYLSNLENLPSGFGEVTKVEGRLHEGGMAACGALGHRLWLTRPDSGGGMLLDLMVHLTNILELLGLHLTDIHNVRLLKNVGERQGAFVELQDRGACEDQATVDGYLNHRVPVILSVSKFARSHDRWLRFWDARGQSLTLRFGNINTLEFDLKGISVRPPIRLESDPYLLTMLDALTFLSGSGTGNKYFREQGASVALAEAMKKAYWSSRS